MHPWQFAAPIVRLPHHFHIASGAVGVSTAPSWLFVVIGVVALVAAGLYWASTRV